jgi:hypothetical protein
MDTKFFSMHTLSQTQQTRLEELLAAAERAKKLRQGEAFEDAMRLAYTYYLKHSSVQNHGDTGIEKRVEALMEALPNVRRRQAASMNAWKGALMILLGIGGAFGFLYLYFNPHAPYIPKALLFAGLVAFTALIISIPMLFRGGRTPRS